jgi:hypothetical protein
MRVGLGQPTAACSYLHILEQSATSPGRSGQESSQFDCGCRWRSVLPPPLANRPCQGATAARQLADSPANGVGVPPCPPDRHRSRNSPRSARPRSLARSSLAGAPSGSEPSPSGLFRGRIDYSNANGSSPWRLVARQFASQHESCVNRR